MSLARRVASLEDGAPGPCPECAHDPDALVTYEITWETDEDAPEESSPACGTCGNVSVEVIDWEDSEARSERSQAPYKKLRPHVDDEYDPVEYDPGVRGDAEGAAAQVPDYPPRWDDEGGGVDG